MCVHCIFVKDSVHFVAIVLIGIIIPPFLQTRNFSIFQTSVSLKGASVCRADARQKHFEKYGHIYQTSV